MKTISAFSIIEYLDKIYRILEFNHKDKTVLLKSYNGGLSHTAICFYIDQEIGKPEPTLILPVELMQEFKVLFDFKTGEVV